MSWSHHLALLEKLDSEEQRLWYAQAALEYGWSRNILAIQIDTHLRERQGAAQTNFTRTLPAPQSDLAVNLLKDPYVFDFLTRGRPRTNAIWSGDCCGTCASSYWNSW